MRRRIPRYRLVAPLLVAAVMLAACGAPDGAATPAGGAVGLSADAFFARQDAALQRDGLVSHVVVTQTATRDGATTPQWTAESWWDADHNAGRRAFHKAPEFSADIADESTTITTADGTYNRAVDDVAQGGQAGCLGLPQHPIVDFLACSSVVGLGLDVGVTDQPAARTTSASYAGQAVIALDYEQALPATTLPEGAPTPTGAEPRGMTISFYAAPDTLLPIAWVVNLRDAAGNPAGTLTTTFDADFLARDALANDFFTPASLGYVEPDLPASLDDPDLGVPVYWLGESFDPGGDLPTLSLRDVLGVRPPGGGPGDRVMLSYDHGVTLQIWRPADWEAYRTTELGHLLWDGPCVQTQTVAFDGGQATIYLAHEALLEREFPQPSISGQPAPTAIPTPTPVTAEQCPAAFDRFAAEVDVDGAVIAINAPLCLSCGARPFAPDPYDSLAGLEALINGLRRR